jgi:hypothetical protein
VASEIKKATAEKSVMDRWAVQNLVAWAAGRDGKDDLKADLTREIRENAASLSGPTPTPAEAILAETAALSLFALRMHEAHFSGACSTGNGMSIAQAKFHLAKIDRAHARLMSTMKTLATVRRLAIPAVQINVARQQVNQQTISSGLGLPSKCSVSSS